jgi:hypothetical protein
MRGSKPWSVVSGPEPLKSGWDGQRVRFTLRRGRKSRAVVVVFDVDGLALTEGTTGGRAAATLGRSAIEPYLCESKPPRVIHVHDDDDVEPGDPDDPAARTHEVAARRGPRGVARLIAAHGGELARAAGTAAATVVAWSGAALAIPGFAEWFYPGALVALLIAALLGSWVWTIVRLGRPTALDQRRLDRILGVATRRAITALDNEDFRVAWREAVVWDLRPLLEMDAVEDRFEPGRLEACRSRFLWAVAALLDVEANNAWNHDRQDHLRNVGVSSGEADAGGEPYRRLIWRATLIHESAGVVVQTYDNLIRQARADGFDVPISQPR